MQDPPILRSPWCLCTLWFRFLFLGVQVRESQLLEFLGMTLAGLRPSGRRGAGANWSLSANHGGRRCGFEQLAQPSGGRGQDSANESATWEGRGRASGRPRESPERRICSAVITVWVRRSQGRGGVLELPGGVEVAAGATGRNGTGASKGTGPENVCGVGRREFDPGKGYCLR